MISKRENADHRKFMIILQNFRCCIRFSWFMRLCDQCGHTRMFVVAIIVVMNIAVGSKLSEHSEMQHMLHLCIWIKKLCVSEWSMNVKGL